MAGKASKALVSVMALGTFVVVLDNTIMNVSISALVTDLGTTVSGVQTAISLNALMMAAFVLMGGKLADIIGMRRTFLLGAVLYVCGSLLASFSNNIWVFILGWCAIQGVGAALMLPNVNTIIRANVAGTARVKAYGMMAGINAIGTAVGPLIGGFLTTYFSWRWAFRLEVGILAFVLLRSAVIPGDKLPKRRPSLDKIGVAWQAVAMMLLIIGVLGISNYGLFLAKQPFVIGSFEFALFGLSIVPFLFVAGLYCLYRFARHEQRRKAAKLSTLVDLALLKVRDFVRGLNVRFLQVALIAGTTFAVPLYLQVTFGLSAFATGFILLGLTAGLLLTALGGAKYGLKYSPKQKVRAGFMVAIAGLLFLALTLLVIRNPWGLVPGLFVYGLGLGLIASQIVNLVMSAARPDQTAEASGITSTLETLGSSVGTAIIGTVLVVSLTGGVSRLVANSTVFSDADKSKITSQLSSSIEVVSDEVLSEQIQLEGAEKAEVETIYKEARRDAFIITLLFMAAVASGSFILAGGLPGKKPA